MFADVRVLDLSGRRISTDGAFDDRLLETWGPGDVGVVSHGLHPTRNLLPKVVIADLFARAHASARPGVGDGDEFLNQRPMVQSLVVLSALGCAGWKSGIGGQS